MLICLILIDSFCLILDRILVISFKYVLKPFYHVLQMARTRQTARKRTGGRAFARRTVPAPAEPVPAPAPAPVLAQPEEEVEEVPGRDYFFDEDQEGNIWKSRCGRKHTAIYTVADASTRSRPTTGLFRSSGSSGRRR